MGLYLIQRESVDVISLADAKAHLRVDFDDDNAWIQRAIRAVVRNMERRVLHRALVDQTWELRLTSTPCEPVKLPMPPLIGVESITYYDDDNAQQTASASLYEVIGAGANGRGEVHLVSGESWPTVYQRAEPFTIRFRAGYIDTQSSPNGEVPEPIVSALLLHLGTLYAHRETIVLGQVPMELPQAARWLIDDYIVYD